MIKIVNTEKELKQFIYFVKKLYKTENNYVLPFFKVQFNELRKEVLYDKNYHALLCIHKNVVYGRILYTFKDDLKTGKKVCYFSFFDFVDDFSIAYDLVDEMKEHALKCGVTRFEGPYCPYDPDTRRGVLTNNFNKMPSVFLTYNYPYYVEIYEKLGFKKKVDTYSMSLEVSGEVLKKVLKMGKISKRENIIISTLNRKHIEDDIKALVDVMSVATTEVNYEVAPTYELIQSIFKQMRLFLKDEYIIIAREQETNKPIGFLVILPELNQVFSKMNGKFNIFKFLLYRNKINKTRGWLQYVIPEYQNTMLLGLMFSKAGEAHIKNRIVEFEGGTIVEHNKKSYEVFEHFGGKIDKVYRIYEMESDDDSN